MFIVPIITGFDCYLLKFPLEEMPLCESVFPAKPSVSFKNFGSDLHILPLPIYPGKH